MIASGLSFTMWICLVGADDATAPRSFAQYETRVTAAQREFSRAVDAARTNLLRDLRNLERRYTAGNNADQLVSVRDEIARIESQVVSVEDLVKRVLDTTYRWAGGASMYRFELKDGKLYGRLNDDPPVEWQPVNAQTLRTAAHDQSVREIVFTRDLRSFLYQTAGGETRTGTIVE